jgi:hypothetical protein
VNSTERNKKLPRIELVIRLDPLFMLRFLLLCMNLHSEALNALVEKDCARPTKYSHKERTPYSSIGRRMVSTFTCTIAKALVRMEDTSPVDACRPNLRRIS